MALRIHTHVLVSTGTWSSISEALVDKCEILQLLNISCVVSIFDYFFLPVTTKERNFRHQEFG